MTKYKYCRNEIKQIFANLSFWRDEEFTPEDGLKFIDMLLATVDKLTKSDSLKNRVKKKDYYGEVMDEIESQKIMMEQVDKPECNKGVQCLVCSRCGKDCPAEDKPDKECKHRFCEANGDKCIKCNFIKPIKDSKPIKVEFEEIEEIEDVDGTSEAVNILIRNQKKIIKFIKDRL